MKKVYKVGIYEKGSYDTVKDKKAYRTWKNILQRCYDEKTLERFPTYVGCEICDEWVYFQNFADWYHKNYVDGYTLDKDILGDGKLYSPDTCCFVPNHINNILHENKHKQNELPLGVNLQDGRYRVRISDRGRKINVGYYSTVSESLNAYNESRKAHIESVLSEYKLNDRIITAIKEKLYENTK